MRIALISHTSAPWTPKYARRFLLRGHGVRVFSFSPDPLEGAEVVFLKGSGARRLTRAARLLAAVPRLRRELKGFGPDIVLATYLASNGVTAALAWNGPLVVSARGGDLLARDGTIPGGKWLHPVIVRHVCRRAGAVHAVSWELVDRLVDCGMPRERIVCFPTGVDLDLFRPVESARPPGAPVRLLCTRRQEPVYRNELLVSALGRLRDRGAAFTCAIAGGGPLLDRRRAQAESLGLGAAVVFTGPIQPAAVGDLLRAADVYLSASSSDGTSSSLLEAMACGVLPVVSRIPANQAWIRDGENGLLFDQEDPADLDRALDRALSDQDLRVSAAARNRPLVEREGDLAKNCDLMLDLLQGVAGGSASQLRIPFQSKR
ncbi:MAG TPA: glycosyltransferase [Candidatus Polarisedimenticolia bacterium]|nr:glycosyltransferase [Candidatus Polarisedimenticolia bacterium]